jgi:hypothetical protein
MCINVATNEIGLWYIIVVNEKKERSLRHSGSVVSGIRGTFPPGASKADPILDRIEIFDGGRVMAVTLVNNYHLKRRIRL